MTAPMKLIEVVLPLDAINKEVVREKSIRHGHSLDVASLVGAVGMLLGLLSISLSVRH